MLYLIDSADLQAIEKIEDEFPIAVAQPAILRELQRNVRHNAPEIRAITQRGQCFRVQTLEVEYEKMLAEAEELRGIAGENCYVKVPVTRRSRGR